MKSMPAGHGFIREVTAGALGNAVGAGLVIGTAALATLAYRAAATFLPSIASLLLVGFFVVASWVVGFVYADKRRRKLYKSSEPPELDAVLGRHKAILGDPCQALIVTVGHRGRLVQAYWKDKDTLALKLPVNLLNWWAIEFKLDRLIGDVNFNGSWDLGPLPPYMKKDPIPPQTERGFMFDYMWRITPEQNSVLRINPKSPVLCVLHVSPHAYFTFRGTEFQVDGGSQIEVLIPPSTEFGTSDEGPTFPPALTLARGPRRPPRI